MILFAAGETMNPDHAQFFLPEIRNENFQLCLKHLCREAIRKHLLQMSPVNLFVRAPKLELPTIITDYLLYGVNLDEDDNDGDTDE